MTEGTPDAHLDTQQEGDADWVVYCDESGIVKGPPCYTIGAMAVRSNRVHDFENWFEASYREHGCVGEVKWSKVGKSYGLINFVLDFFYSSLPEADCRFHFIVVNKQQFRKWRGDREAAFYQTYTYLVQNVARFIDGTHRIIMDEKSDSYAHRAALVQTIGNNMLGQRRGQGALVGVTKEESGAFSGLQAIDTITGAINSAHGLFLKPKLPTNAGKRLAINRLARILDWDGLHYDTWPNLRPGGPRNETFNIWHFPEEFRGIPGSMNLPNDPIPPQWVTQEELAAAYELSRPS